MFNFLKKIFSQKKETIKENNVDDLIYQIKLFSSIYPGEIKFSRLEINLQHKICIVETDREIKFQHKEDIKEICYKYNIQYVGFIDTSMMKSMNEIKKQIIDFIGQFNKNIILSIDIIKEDIKIFTNTRMDNDLFNSICYFIDFFMEDYGSMAISEEIINQTLEEEYQLVISPDNKISQSMKFNSQYLNNFSSIFTFLISVRDELKFQILNFKNDNISLYHDILFETNCIHFNIIIYDYVITANVGFDELSAPIIWNIRNVKSNHPSIFTTPDNFKNLIDFVYKTFLIRYL